MLNGGIVDRRVIPDRAAERGLDKAGGNRVDLNVIRGQFNGEHFRQHQHRGLTNTVDPHVGQRCFASDGGQVDHLATTPLAHTRDTGTHQAEITFDIDIENLIPVALFAAEQGAKVRIGRRIVDQNVDAPEFCASAVNQVLYAIGIAGVGGNR